MIVATLVQIFCFSWRQAMVLDEYYQMFFFFVFASCLILSIGGNNMGFQKAKSPGSRNKRTDGYVPGSHPNSQKQFKAKRKRCTYFTKFE